MIRCFAWRFASSPIGRRATLRQDLEDFVGALALRGVYTNLITAGVTLTPDRIKRLADRGLDHVQLSLQGVDPEVSDNARRACTR